MPLSSRTPCSRALSWSLAATPPITRSSLCVQIDKVCYISNATVSICWYGPEVQAIIIYVYVHAFWSWLTPEFGVIHIFLKLLNIIESLFSQLFRGFNDQRFGTVGRCFHLAHFGTACTHRAEEAFQQILYWKWNVEEYNPGKKNKLPKKKKLFSLT